MPLMGKLQQDVGVLNEGDELRVLIAECEKMLAALSPTNARALMETATKAHALHQRLEEAGSDMRSEVTRLDTIYERIVKSAKRIVDGVSGNAAFQQMRQQLSPSTTERWWRLDDVLAEQRRALMKRLAVTGAVVALVAVAAFLFRGVLFPPDPVGDAVIAAQHALEQRDTTQALQALDLGLTKVPTNTTLLIWRAALLEKRGDPSVAKVFAQARAIAGDTAFLLERAQVDLALGNNDRAIADMTASIQMNPSAPEAYFLRASAFENKNEVDHAMADLNMAADLAQKQGNDTLYATARVRLGTLMQVSVQRNSATP